MRTKAPALAALSLLLVAAGAPYWPGQLPSGLAAPSVPPGNPMSAAKVELGRRLFYDADLSADGTMACATCHEQKHAFADGNCTHPGVTGEPGRRNVPGLANVAWFGKLTFADPAQTSLEAQVAVPVTGTHPVEMGMAGREAEIGQRLARDACYRTMFRKAFPEDGGKIDFANTARAIASFERTLVSLDSPYDRGQLSPQAVQGQALFEQECAACHSGSFLTDMAYHRTGAYDENAADQGLSEATGRADDAGKFRTPSLRNTALTGPWWHDGSAGTLEQAIIRHGTSYGPKELARLTAFLESLSDTGFTQDKALSLPDKACGKRL
ncbi:MAG: cytochrome c peroxidase [Novosphingobium sp.]|nr:cytochrome c peroxidase [Novosphingobium sp.]